MNNTHSTIARRGTAPASYRRWWAAPLACLATLLALPVGAATDIPDDPLTTGARVPPNVLFVLDDSGSMAFEAMPANAVSDTWTTRTYVHNAVYYNPAKTYLPWVGADGTPLSGGTSYDAAYGSFNLVGGSTIDLGDSGSCGRFNHNQTPRGTDEFATGGTLVCGGPQRFYVPKDPTSTNTSYLGNSSNYYMYKILRDGSGIVRGERGTVSESSTNLTISPGSGSVQQWNENTHTVTVPASATSASFSLTSSLRSVMYYVLDPNNIEICSGQVNEGNTGTCHVPDPLAGTYQLIAWRWDRANSQANYTLSASSATGNRCGPGTGNTDWINCSAALPSASRSLSQELANYATWFSYHRTRMKAAKAGASAAFSELGTNIRVGFRTIWQQNGSVTTGNWPRQAVPIPVQYNDGLFDDVTIDGDTHDNRSKWYRRLHGAIGQNGTPLHGALFQAGTYFGSDAVTGPYGPQSGADQLACRQNFTILTTDGYWNNETQNYPSESRVGNVDGTDGPTITEASTGASYTYEAVAPYADAHGETNGTLADVAMQFWKNDLRTGMRNIVPTTDANPAFWQHMVTFGLSIGL
ncbi:MAG TPA: hypothetical protein PLS34_12400, partial [Gammaproteobacteria bacterium]|nr:hypothetical protein [Gammaproteobacteria bacterium]